MMKSEIKTEEPTVLGVKRGDLVFMGVPKRSNTIAGARVLVAEVIGEIGIDESRKQERKLDRVGTGIGIGTWTAMRRKLSKREKRARR